MKVFLVLMIPVALAAGATLMLWLLRKAVKLPW
jgi:hypothetical protein